MVVQVALTQAQTTALFAQVLACALVGGIFLVATKRRTETVSVQVAFLTVALLLTVLVHASAGWYVLLLWLLFVAVQAIPSALVGWLR